MVWSDNLNPRGAEADFMPANQVTVSVEIDGVKVFQHDCDLTAAGASRTSELLVTQDHEALAALRHALTESLVCLCGLDEDGNAPEPVTQEDADPRATNGVYHFPVNDE